MTRTYAPIIMAATVVLAALLTACGGTPSGGSNPTSRGGAATPTPRAAPTPTWGPEVTINYNTSEGNVPYGFAAMAPTLVAQEGLPANPGKYWLVIEVKVINEQTDRSAGDPTDLLEVTTGGCNPSSNNSDVCDNCSSADSTGTPCTPNLFTEFSPSGVFVCTNDEANHSVDFINANSYVTALLCPEQVTAIPSGLSLWFPEGDEFSPDANTYTSITIPGS